MNRNVTTAEYPFVWDAVNHLSGGGFDEHGRSSALCYGQHARRNDQAPYRRLIIDGAALNADALIELGRTLRPERGGAAPRHKKGAEHKRARIEEVERARLMGNVLPPDDYNHWMSGAGAFKRAFPGDPEAAFTCFDAWAACSSKYQGSQAAHSKFDEVAADYEGTAAPVTLEMLHWRTRRRAEARKQAKKLLTEAPTRNPAMSFATAYENYKQSIAGLRPKTQAEYKRFLDKYFVPQIGRKRLAELQYEEVIACVKDGAKSEAAHALAVCRTFLRWCVRLPRRYLIHSPLEGVQVKFGNKRKRILKPEELKTVWGAAQEQGYPYGTIVQLLIALGQRRGETANLSWEWINETDRTITLPETITKNHKEHTFPYGDLVAAILETIPRRNSTDLLFPSRVSEERPISGWSKFKADLGDGLPAWRLHDLRRTFRTTLAEIGTPAEIAERLINHAAAVQTDVESIYDRYHYMPQMRKAVEAFDEHFRVLLKKADGRSNLLAA